MTIAATVGTRPEIPLFDVELSEGEIEAVVAALRSGWLTMGPRTQAFEDAFADHLGVRHAVAVANGTAALHLAYLAAGIGPGDEVILPAITFVATANAVRYCGATPVLADIAGQHDFGIDPDHVRALITPRTKAVVAVHYAGYSADMRTLTELCREHGLVLIEDAAHAPSTRPAGDAGKAGSRGLAAAFSFFSNKVLGCGEGGLVSTDDDAVAAFVRSRRAHALTSGTWDRHRGHAMGYDVVGLGYNYRIDEPRAALLHARLKSLDDDVAVRRALVGCYRELLAGVQGVSIPYTDDEVEHSSCYVMPIVVDDAALRDPLRLALAGRGIQTSVLYPAVHEFTAYRGTAPAPLPRSERVARTELTLPLYPHLSYRGVKRVVAAVSQSLDDLRAG